MRREIPPFRLTDIQCDAGVRYRETDDTPQTIVSANQSAVALGRTSCPIFSGSQRVCPKLEIGSRPLEENAASVFGILLVLDVHPEPLIP